MIIVTVLPSEDNAKFTDIFTAGLRKLFRLSDEERKSVYEHKHQLQLELHSLLIYAYIIFNIFSRTIPWQLQNPKYLKDVIKHVKNLLPN